MRQGLSIGSIKGLPGQPDIKIVKSWVSCRDDLGLDDKVVYKPEVELADKPADVPTGEPAGKPDSNLPKKKRRTTHSGGSRRHGRPPDSQAPTTMPPPSAITFKDSTTLPVGVSGHSAAEETVTGTFLSTFAVDSTPGPVTSTSTRDEASKPPLPHAPKPF